MNITKILIIIGLNIVFWPLIVMILYYISPVHETFHYLPCKAAGLSPTINYFNVTCDGIQEKTDTTKFFYYMGPYIFDFILIILFSAIAIRYKYWKYAIPLPALDILVNYALSPGGADFLFFLRSTQPNFGPFNISVIMVGVALLITGIMIFELKVYAFDEIIQKYFKK